MKRHLLCLLLCLFAVGLAAQTLEEEANPELLLDELDDLSATALIKEQEAHKFAIASSYQDAAWKGQFQYKTGKWQNRGNLLYKGDNPHYKYQLRYGDTLALGHYRFAWGEGLVFAKATAAPEILAPAAAQSYSPLGVAFGWDYQGLRLDLGASEQERQVRQKDGMISSIPKSAGSLLVHSRERLHYAALGFDGIQLKLGSIYYRQEYDTAFAPALGDSLLCLFDSYIAFQAGHHKLKAEWLWQKEPSYIFSWKQEQKRFSQYWSYKHLGDYQKPAYSARMLRLINKPNREEISAKFVYSPTLKLYCELNSTLNSAVGQISPKGWQSEELLKLRYTDAQSRAELQFINISRDILTAIDSLYSSSKARHQRLNFRLSQRVAKDLRLQLGIRYQYQEREQSLLQGIYWEQSLKYQKPGISASLGYALWNSSKYPLYIYDEYCQDYQSHASAAAALKLACAYTWRGWGIKTHLQQDINKSHKSQLNLQVQYQCK